VTLEKTTLRKTVTTEAAVIAGDLEQADLLSKRLLNNAQSTGGKHEILYELPDNSWVGATAEAWARRPGQWMLRGKKKTKQQSVIAGAAVPMGKCSAVTDGYFDAFSGCAHYGAKH
jgi:hypothetical protein